MNTRPDSNVLRSTLRNLRFIVFFAVAFSFLYNMLRLTGPLFMILIYDRVLPSRSEATLVALFLLVVIFLIVMAMIDYSQRRILARFGAQFQERIENHIFTSTRRDAYLTRSSGKPTDGLDEVDKLRSFFHSSSLVAVLDFLWSPIFLATIFLIHWTIGWVVVGGLVLLAMIVSVRSAFAKDRGERFDQASGRIGELKDMLLVSRDVIQSQQMTAAYNERWVRARRGSRDRAVELNDWNAWFSTLSKHAAMLMQYSVLATGAYLTLSDQLTIGAMVACMFLAVRVFYPVERFLKQLRSIREATADWKNLDRILRTARSSAPIHLEVGTDGLSLSQLTVRSPLTRQKLLRTVDLDIGPGSAVEIVGRSGSGKTVLAEAILGQMPRMAGMILFGGIDIDRLSIADAASTFGYVPQNVAFVNGTIEENIAGLDVDPDKDRLIEAARTAQVHDLIRALPNGYGTRMDAAGAGFSKGERHQIALARALYSNPKVLIVDEPDATFREGLSRNLKGGIADFLDRGGILIVLSRMGLKTFQPTLRFTLEEGQLRELKPVQADRARPASNVVTLSQQKLLEKVGTTGDES
jgi:ABC-type protease/lipase transport system fused ATPase/permease subunit